MTGARALYLDAAAQWDVAVDDDVALRVSAPGRTRALYPLARLARVVTPAHAQWSTPALLACLRAGVPVLFHDAQGRALGWCFGPRRRETTLGALVREALDRPEWDAWFRDWHAAAERRHVLEALCALHAGGGSPQAPAARARLCNRHRDRLGRPVGALLRAARRPVAALAAARLHEAVGDPKLIGYARPGLHLAESVAGLLEWALHRALWATPAAELLRHDAARAAVRLVEHDARVHAALGELLGDLERQLRDWLW